MGPGDFFAEQFDELERALLDPDQVVRRIVVDPELRPMVLRYLARRDEDPDFPHVLVGFDAPFRDPITWFDQLAELLRASAVRHAESLLPQGIDLRSATEPIAAMRAPERCLTMAEGLTQALPDEVGTLVLVLDVAVVDDLDGFRRSIAFLADYIRTPWLKVVVLDPRLEPRLDAFAREHPRVGSQTFWLSPEDLERRAAAQLASLADRPSPERRQALAMLAGMALARKDHARAEALQRELAGEAEKAGAPLEAATALYNLGNTLLADGRAAEAAGSFARACALCLDHGLGQLASVVYTNLGVALHREGDFDQAFASLKVARDLFKAQNNRPGEAHVCDALGAIYHELDRPDEAAHAWRYALQLYDGITNPALADVRASGRAALEAKLRELGQVADGRR
jgi:tetratricopeptide (TPR) repeat protein